MAGTAQPAELPKLQNCPNGPNYKALRARFSDIPPSAYWKFSELSEFTALSPRNLHNLNDTRRRRNGSPWPAKRSRFTLVKSGQ